MAQGHKDIAVRQVGSGSVAIRGIVLLFMESEEWRFPLLYTGYNGKLIFCIFLLATLKHIPSLPLLNKFCSKLLAIT